MESKQRKHAESGQVLVFLSLVFIGLLGFTALAVDGGMIFHDRRSSQNAADAAALAGGWKVANALEDADLGLNINYNNWDCASSELQTAQSLGITQAIQIADLNQRPISDTIANLNGVTTFCMEEDKGSYIDKYVDVEVWVTSQVRTAFVHFAFNGPVNNTVKAVSRVRPRMPLAFGYAVYAHRDSCPNSNVGGVQFLGGGNGSVTITGGGIMSDACLEANSAAVNVTVNNGNIYSVEAPNVHPQANVSPSPAQVSNPLPQWSLLFTEPDCSGLPNQGSQNGGGTISPGIYSSIQNNNNQTLELQPGLYCLDGDFRINGGTVIGNGVTIYMRNGDFISNGNATVKLSAPGIVVGGNQGTTGMLIYMALDNAGDISLLGSATSYYRGTIFGASADSTVEVGGTGSMLQTYETQLIAGTVKVHGTATIDISFNQSQNYMKPAQMTLEE